MTIYARIDTIERDNPDTVGRRGKRRRASLGVAELFTPPAEFSHLPISDLFHTDLEWVDVTNISPKPQIGWTYDGTVFAPPAPPPPLTDQQQAVKQLDCPIVTIVCKSLPALNGNYTADTATRSHMTAVAQTINAGLGLPSGGSTFDHRDVMGKPHAWPAAQFLVFCKELIVYIYNLSQVAGGAGGSLPSNVLTIA